MENYPILTEWMNNGLKNKWEEYKQNIINSNPKLSPIFAGCLAARILGNEFDSEYANIYNYRAKKGDTSEFLNFVDECNFKMEDENFRNDLVNWSGTRWNETDSEIEQYKNAAHGLEPNRIQENEKKTRELKEKAEQVKIMEQKEKDDRERKNREFQERKEKERKESEERQERERKVRYDYFNKYHPSLLKRSYTPFEYLQEVIKDDIDRGIDVPEQIKRDYRIL